MPGLPVNSLNSIEGPLSVPGVMGCFRSLEEACAGEGWVLLYSAGGGRGRGVMGSWDEAPALAGAQRGGIGGDN